MTDLDAKLTFDSFVVGPANRLASAAAKRAAESPGTSYNPLFVYSASGLGKSHILTAIAHQANKIDSVGVWRRAADLNPHNEAVRTNLELLSGE
jgi:chromosomal replication initiator protein